MNPHLSQAFKDANARLPVKNDQAELLAILLLLEVSAGKPSEPPKFY